VDSNKKQAFDRGYSTLRKRMEKNSKYTMSCFNCDWYYQAVGDTEEVCQNEQVLKYDMVVTDTSIYCSQWKPIRVVTTNSVKSIFKQKR
jgi:hypothetical protein